MEMAIAGTETPPGGLFAETARPVWLADWEAQKAKSRAGRKPKWILRKTESGTAEDCLFEVDTPRTPFGVRKVS